MEKKIDLVEKFDEELEEGLWDYKYVLKMIRSWIWESEWRRFIEESVDLSDWRMGLKEDNE